MAKNKKKKVQNQPKKATNFLEKKWPGWVKYALLGALVVLIVVLIVVFLNTGPLDELEKAAKNTIYADNFTIMYTLDVDGETADGYINLSIDPDKRTLDMYMTLETKRSDYDCGIYKNDFVVVSALTNEVYCIDIADRLDNFFDALDEDGKPDWSVLLDFSETDLHELISQDFNFPVFINCLSEWLDNLNDKDWAEEKAGYSVSKKNGITTHNFRPNPYTLACATIPMFRSSFKDGKQYEQLLDYVDKAKYLFVDGKANFSFQVQDSYLVGANFEIEYFNTHIKGDFSIIGINKTIVDIGAVQDYIADAKEED